MNKPTEVKVMAYVDFKLTVDTEPDINGCMWVTLNRWSLPREQTWDMNANCVARLRDACSKFLEHIDAIQQEDTC